MGNKRLTDEDIKKIYEEFNTPEHVKGHCRGVTDCAMRIAKALNEHGHSLDLELVYGAGMIHDAARTSDEHWNVMADKLEELGYHDEACIVRVHMEPCNYNPIDKISEVDMVCLGDRLVKEDKYVGIDERFDYIVEKARRHGVLNYDKIMKNKAKMQKCLDEIKKEIGCSVDELYSLELKYTKDREASFQDKKLTEWLKNAPENGLCLKKWHADYEADIVDEDGSVLMKEGDVVDMGNRHFEITRVGKRCWPECELIKEEGKKCPLATGVAFGKKVAVVKAVCISEKKGEQKHEVPEVELKVDHGIVGDAHAGNWHRQVSILGKESVDMMQGKLDIELKPGDFAENILAEGIIFHELEIGTTLMIGSSVVEVTQIGKECHSDCAIRKLAGDCVMPREGIFVKVLQPGTVKAGDIVSVLK